jgi:hypothetical protein
MSRKTVTLTLTLTWRDENYGRIWNAKAFRSTPEPNLSDSAMLKLARLYRRSGFNLNQGRMSWIAEDCPDETLIQLVDALTLAGFTVVHRGCVPSVLDTVTIAS